MKYLYQIVIEAFRVLSYIKRSNAIYLNSIALNNLVITKYLIFKKIQLFLKYRKAAIINDYSDSTIVIFFLKLQF